MLAIKSDKIEKELEKIDAELVLEHFVRKIVRDEFDTDIRNITDEQMVEIITHYTKKTEITDAYWNDGYYTGMKEIIEIIKTTNSQMFKDLKSNFLTNVINRLNKNVFIF